ncbi:armadillo-type protein [Syncephalastrum racemosum]|uniref:Armadillo-type protein n=1 Tax=Syncephalastrum racemosum TaxID=13706 RepID=A0A1X2H6F6_SYNRA|nr:armadillo-type protein [Syncephalastrum racemosum]
MRKILEVQRVTQGPDGAALFTTLFENMMKGLYDISYRVRSACLDLMPIMVVLFHKLDSHTAAMEESLTNLQAQKTIGAFVEDWDARVRKSALEALVDMRMRQSSLDASLYPVAVKALRDDYEEVRASALDVIWALTCSNPDHVLDLHVEGSAETIRLNDDAFAKVCDLVNDIKVEVRTKACVLMGSFRNVQLDILLQTFSKRIMSRLKRRVTNKATGKKRLIPIAEGDFEADPDEYRLLDSGACGAFIHGLEDEYEEVRYAAIDSICELCIQNEQLVSKAVENLVDMFNDEIPRVRINAIQSLRKIGTHSPLQFNHEQLGNALGSLEESDPIPRRSMHELLRVTRFKEPRSLTDLLAALRRNLERFPEDEASIMGCLAELGKTHHSFISNLLVSLLNFDPRFLPREANIHDISHIMNCILIINACTRDAKILPRLPTYVFSHLNHYTIRYPDCMPDLKLLYASSPTHISVARALVSLDFLQEKDRQLQLSESRSKTHQALADIRELIRQRNFVRALSKVRITKEELQGRHQTRLQTSGADDMCACYLSCCETLLLLRMKLPVSEAVCRRILGRAMAMQRTVLGISSHNRQVAVYFELLAHILILLDKRKSSSTIPFMEYAMKCMHRVEQAKREFAPENPAVPMLENLYIALCQIKQKLDLASIDRIAAFTRDFVPLHLDLDNQAKSMHAIILAPISNSDKPVKIRTPFPLHLTIEADIFYVVDTSQIAIEITSPDKKKHHFWPASAAFTPTTAYSYKLATSFEMSLSPWTQTCPFDLRIVNAGCAISQEQEIYLSTQ